MDWSQATPETLAKSLRRPSRQTRQVRLAQTLIREWTDDKFNFARYEDLYRERLGELIDAKVKGRELVSPAQDELPDVVNLMDALKKSVNAAPTSRPRTRSCRRSA